MNGGAHRPKRLPEIGAGSAAIFLSGDFGVQTDHAPFAARLREQALGAAGT